MRTLIAIFPLLCMAALFGMTVRALAIKHNPDPLVELERVRTELRLRNAELLVVRGQLRACEAKAK